MYMSQHYSTVSTAIKLSALRDMRLSVALHGHTTATASSRRRQMPVTHTTTELTPLSSHSALGVFRNARSKCDLTNEMNTTTRK